MNKFMNLMMFSCKKATELIEKKNFQALSFNEKIKLNVHTKMCKQCKTFEKQSILFDKVFSKISSKKTEVPYKENEELKKRILDSLKLE